MNYTRTIVVHWQTPAPGAPAKSAPAASTAPAATASSSGALVKKEKERTLMRRKSELPHDNSITRSLETYKRADEFLKTQSEFPR